MAGLGTLRREKQIWGHLGLHRETLSRKKAEGMVFFKHEDINKQLKFIDAGLIHYLSLHLTVDNKSLKLVVFMGVLP